MQKKFNCSDKGELHLLSKCSALIPVHKSSQHYIWSTIEDLFWLGLRIVWRELNNRIKESWFQPILRVMLKLGFLEHYSQFCPKITTYNWSVGRHNCKERCAVFTGCALFEDVIVISLDFIDRSQEIRSEKEGLYQLTRLWCFIILWPSWCPKGRFCLPYHFLLDVGKRFPI